MGDTRPHRKLDVWQKAMDFVLEVYEMTRGFPKAEVSFNTNHQEH